jgi:hypothetical protein
MMGSDILLEGRRICSKHAVSIPYAQITYFALLAAYKKMHSAGF